MYQSFFAYPHSFFDDYGDFILTVFLILTVLWIVTPIIILGMRAILSAHLAEAKRQTELLEQIVRQLEK